jgi:hypothetical protein
MATFVLVGLLTIPVYMSGEPAEDAVRGLPDVTRDLVHEHEDAALFGIISASLNGAIALMALLLEKRRERLYRPLTITVLVVALWSSAVLARVSYLGGLVRHSEIRQTPAVAAPK